MLIPPTLPPLPQLTDMYENAIGHYGTIFGHSLMDLPTWQGLQKACFPVDDGTGACHQLQAVADAAIAGMDPYALDFPVCTSARTGQAAERLRLLSFLRGEQRARALAAAYPYDPCREGYATSYLNRPDVQAALHVDKRPAPAAAWAECSTAVNYSQSDVNTPMEPVYKWLLTNAPALKIVIFSGDDDTICATQGTQLWLNTNMTDVLRVRQAWAPWSMADRQVAGFSVKYAGPRSTGITLVTVHTAGHEVESFQPARGLEVLRRYLDGEWTS